MRRAARFAVALVTLSCLASCIGSPVAAPPVTPQATTSPGASKPAVTLPSVAPTATPIPQPPDKPPVSFARADFSRGEAYGVNVGDGLTLAADGLITGSYDDPYRPRQIPHGLAFESGSWTSAWTVVPFPFDELVASWNADTPAGTWIQIQMQARGAGRTTKNYTMAIWASGDTDIHRTSVPAQLDLDGDVNIDTFVRSKTAPALDSYRLLVTLYRAIGRTVTPTVRMVAAMTSAAFDFAIPSPFEGSAVDLAVPTLSQEIHTGEFPQYDGGGEAWCSPTSTAMVLAFHGAGPTPDDLTSFPGPSYDDPMVDYAARYTYDWNYKGAGNWPANVAYATRFGLEGFVTRLRSLNEAQRFIEASIPLVASINGALPGFLGGTTNGHLLVIRGFTANGDVITNDPAAKSDPETHKVYRRADFERVWLGGSAGIVYVIYPKGKALPPNVPGLPLNW
jgi:hypothetical protein